MQPSQEMRDMFKEAITMATKDMITKTQYRNLVTDVRAVDDGELEYVISDESRDRHGTIIKASGWQLENFLRNPIALFNHNTHFIVGSWRKVRVEGDKLLGRLMLLPSGVSERLDEIRAAVEAKVLRGVSVGFRLIETDPKDSDIFTKQELMEVSLVSVPSNTNAMAMARSLNLSNAAKDLIFGVSAEEDQPFSQHIHGVSAETNSHSRKTKVNISQQIEIAQAKLGELRGQKEEHIASFGEEPDDNVIAALEAINEQLARQQRLVTALIGTEQASARTAESVTRPALSASMALTAPKPRVFAQPAEKVKPADLIIRGMVVGLLSHLTRRDPAAVMAERYGEHPDTRDVFQRFHGLETRAATAPATTFTNNWASQLIQTVIADFIEQLVPNAVYPRLAALGQRYTFGRNGAISIPTWDSTPNIAGAFTLEGSPIPVKQGSISSVSLTPKKMAVITTFTREIAEHSTPAIENLLRQKIQSDTSISLDTALLDATAVSTTRPAGLLNGVSNTTATAGGGFNALVGDLKNHITALSTALSGSLTRPVFIMNPEQAIAVGLTQNAGGDFPFKDVTLTGGNIQGIPVIVSSTVPVDQLITVDAAWFATVTGDEPRFDVSDQATLHMDDSPSPLSAVGSPNTVAAPLRSLFQTDSLALRMILPMNWVKVRSGIVASSTAVTW